MISLFYDFRHISRSFSFYDQILFPHKHCFPNWKVTYAETKCHDTEWWQFQWQQTHFKNGKNDKKETRSENNQKSANLEQEILLKWNWVENMSALVMFWHCEQSSIGVKMELKQTGVQKVTKPPTKLEILKNLQQIATQNFYLYNMQI